MRFVVGQRQGVAAMLIPSEMLTESVIGQTYMVQIKTSGVPDPKAAAILLDEKLYKNFGIKLYYFEVDGDIITLHIEGSPFVWATLLLFLPQILALIGIAVAMIVVYFIMTSIPTWMYFLAAVGIGLIVFSGTITAAVTPKKKEKS